MIRSRWFMNWSDVVPGTETNRLDALLAMQDANLETLVGGSASVKLHLMKIARLGCLNKSQCGVVINRSRQEVGRLLEEYKIEIDDRFCVRGKLDPRSLAPMIEIVTRIQGGDSVPAHHIIAAQTRTDKSIIALLTGVPVHVLRTVRKDLEDQLGFQFAVD